MFECIWPGINGRSGRVSVGTKEGVVKCRTFKRSPAPEGWDAKLIHEMEGATWEPVPGHKGDPVQVEVTDDGTKNDREEEDADAVSYGVIFVEEEHWLPCRAFHFLDKLGVPSF